MAEHRTPKNGSLLALLGLTALTLAAFSLATIPLVTRVLGQTPASDIQPPGQMEDEVVQSLKVVLSVSSAGENLDEPLALDLGLGFPLWLHRLGRVDQPHAPFGAVSQVGQEAHEIVAGSQATFEFSLDGPAGLDTLHATPQLLSGLRLSDISRVGFCSKADHGWILSSYKLHINGKLFAGRDIDNGQGRGRQDAARELLTDLNAQIAPIQSELSELSALVATGLATEVDSQRYTELSTELAPKLIEQTRLGRQLRGASPFWIDDQFQTKLRSGSALKSLKVTLVTAPHSGADTRNNVYFSVGGHKYLLGSPLMPLSADYGTQEFDIDLASAPLVAADLRGYSLGMLAAPELMSDVPDRWHPQRLRVEVDSRIVYDSEDNTVDRMSMSAIRIIPPVITRNGEVVASQPIAREASVWTTGSAAGLDLVNGGPAQLPAIDDPAYPAAENTGLGAESQENPVDQAADPNDPLSQSSQTSNQLIIDDIAVEEIWYDPFAGPFPGEFAYGPNWEPRLGHRLRRLLRLGLGLLGGGSSGGYPGWYPGWGPGYDPGWGPGWAPGYGPGWGPGYGPGAGSNWLELLLLSLLGQQSGLPNWVLPQPVGQPPQLGSVTVDLIGDSVHWTLSGDESQVDHFAIELVQLRPDLDVPWTAMLTETLDVASSQRTLPLSALTWIPSTDTADAITRSYATVRVRMIPTDPAIGVQQSVSPALPMRVTSLSNSLSIGHHFSYIPLGGPATLRDVSLSGESILPGPLVWAGGEVPSHTGLVFAGVSPLQHHIVARAALEGDKIGVRLHTNAIQPGSYRVIAFASFDGAAQVPAEANVTCNTIVRSVANPALHIGYPAAVNVTSPSFPMTSMQPLITDFNTADVGPGEMTIELRYEFNQLHIDPEHPPMLVGVRLLSM